MNELRPADANSQIVQKERAKCLLIRAGSVSRLGEEGGEGVVVEELRGAGFRLETAEDWRG